MENLNAFAVSKELDRGNANVTNINRSGRGATATLNVKRAGRRVRRVVRLAFVMLAVGPCLAGCQFSGGTALPKPPGFSITSPDGWTFSGDSDLKSDLYVKDGDREIKFKMLQKPSETIDAQAMLAQALVPLAQIESERQKAAWAGLREMFGQLLQAAIGLQKTPPISATATPVTGTGPVVGPQP